MDKLLVLFNYDSDPQGYENEHYEGFKVMTQEAFDAMLAAAKEADYPDVIGSIWFDTYDAFANSLYTREIDDTDFETLNHLFDGVFGQFPDD